MSQRAFSITAAVVFLLIAIGHLLRVVFGASFIVHGIAVPMWASAVAVFFMGFLAYEGFHVARKP